MSITFRCPVCSTSYTVNDRNAGKKSACKKCGQRLQVPGPSASTKQTRLGELTGPAFPTPARPLAEPPGDWWYFDARGDRKAAATFDELRRMAQDGTLRRRDFVKRKGRDEWRRAGTFAALWPGKQLSPEDGSLLTTCGACLGRIAKEAPACPKCGAPNSWIHPESTRFLGRLRKFQRRYNAFDAEARGFMLVCRSTREKQFLDYAANAVGGMGFAGPLSLGGLAVTLGASIGSQYAAKALRDKAGPDTNVFVIDFRHDPPLWSSTDEEFWEDVLDFFDVV